MEDSNIFANLEHLAEIYDCFLFDCDGVLWHGDTEIEGSFNALRYLIAKGKELFFLTNNSSRLRQTLLTDKLHKFGGAGLRVSLDKIYTSAYVTGQYLAD